MLLRNILLIILSLTLITSCASTSITPDQISNANYGQPPTNYEFDIKNLMATQLKDPESAKYDFGYPKKGYSQDGWAAGGAVHFGYIVPVKINAKNSYGGYTGYKQYQYLYSEGMVYDVTNLFYLGKAKYVY